MTDKKLLALYVLAVFVAGFNIYAVGLYYVNKTLPASCEMHDTLMFEECLHAESKNNIIYKLYKG